MYEQATQHRKIQSPPETDNRQIIVCSVRLQNKVWDIVNN